MLIVLNVRYPIKYLESLSGIKAHTIRIWEQRYGVLVPRRTATNIRYYDDTQLRHLLNIVTLLDAGQKISEIAAMTPQAVEALVRQKGEQGNKESVSKERLVNNMILAALKFNCELFETYFSESVNKYGFSAAIEEVLYPTLRRVGVLWQSADMNPAQEHFISNLARQKLFSACDKLSNRNGSNSYLLFLPEGEHHEIGLLYFNYLLLKSAKRTIYLGMDLPLDSLKHGVKLNNPDFLVFFVVSNQPSQALQKYLSTLNRLFRGTKIILCARPELLADLKALPNQHFLASPDEARRFLKG